LDGTLSLETSNSSVDILGNDIATVQHASCHVFPVAWVALYHLVVGLEARHGDLLHRIRLMRCLGGGNNWGVSHEREMDSWIGNQVGLEFVEINVEGAVEAKGGGNGRDN
jgi:hypothetical protein